MGVHLLPIIMVLILCVDAQCRRDSDCVALQTLCHPHLRCDQARKICVAATEGPCAKEKEQVRRFNQQNTVGGGSMGVLCINQIASCVVVPYCTEDAECDDRLYCNGPESCLSGRCARRDNHSFMCRACTEATQCGQVSIQATPSNNNTNNSNTTSAPAQVLLPESAIIAIMSVVSVFAFFAVIAILCYLFASRRKK